MRWRIIDGYNILFTRLRGRVGEFDRSRREFVKQVNWLACKQKIYTSLIFDGSRGRDPGLPREARSDWMEVIYTGPAESADDLIMQMAEETKQPHNTLVVTSDREIISHCKVRKVKIQRAMAFLDEFDPQAARDASGQDEPVLPQENEPRQKSSGIPDEGVEFWMRYFDSEQDE